MSILVFNQFDHDLKAVGLKVHRCENLFEMLGFALLIEFLINYNQSKSVT